MNLRVRLVFLLLLLLLSSVASAAKTDVDYERLRSSLSQLAADPALGGLAPAERALAEQALLALAEKDSRKLHAHLVYMAERRVDTAYAAAQAADQTQRLEQLNREHDQILLAASRRDAEQARLEAEKQRIQSLAQAEETDRLRAEADAARAQGEQDVEAAQQQAAQARRLADAQAKEAELARKEAQLSQAAGADVRTRMQGLYATRGKHGMQITLDDIAFSPGQEGLRPEVKANLGKVVAFVNHDRAKAVRIEGHTDSRGGTKANLRLSQQRADAVRDALAAAGVDRKRMTAVGLGEADPVASNESDEGRARNRRIDVIVLDH